MDMYEQAAQDAIKGLGIESGEENNIDAVEVVDNVEDIQEATEPEVKQESLEEQYARQKGWVPKDEWDDSKGEWIDADEFNRRGPLFETIGKLKDEIRDYKKSSEALIEHNKKLAESARKAEERGRLKAIKELEDKKLEAVRDGDVEAFQAYEEEIKGYEKEIEPSQEGKGTVNEVPEVDPAVEEWAKNNTWFQKDDAMTTYMLDVQRRHLNEGLSVGEALKRSTEKVKSEFAHKFENPNKQKSSGMPGKVDNGQKKGYSMSDIPPEMRSAARAVISKTNMPISEYVEQLKMTGAI